MLEKEKINSIFNFRRIHVTGNAGAGKSTLAKRLGEITGLPVHGLDKIVWQPGWNKTPVEERRVLEASLITGSYWIIEGVSSSVREAADLIVFLDYPRSICAWRCAKRNWRYLFRSRPDLPPQCPELLVLAKLIKIIWNFSRTVRPKIIAEIYKGGSGASFIHLKDNQELKKFLDTVESSAQRAAEVHVVGQSR